MEGARLLLALANWSAILGCAVLKLPQAAVLLATKSARGVSLESLVLELSGGKMKHALPYTVIFVLKWYVLGLQKWIVDLAMNLSTLVSAASKFAQLRCLWQTKDSGQVSALTWSLAAYTCAARIFTTLMTTKDLTVLVRFVVMMALNVWVTATILHYRKTAKKTD